MGTTRAERRRAERERRKASTPTPGHGRRFILPALLIGVGAAVLIFSGWFDGGEFPPPATRRGEILAVHPHDRTAFTQGLVWHQGRLYEGTGRNGRSEIRLVDLESGRVLKSRKLPQHYFGEGVTILGRRIYQLTWRSETGLIHDLETFEKVGEFHYKGQGWGLTDDGQRLVMSDGTSVLRFLDPETFEVVRRLQVRAGSEPLESLNELEWVEGRILANVWGRSVIARIDPESGAVEEFLDLSHLKARADAEFSGADVLNGIAWDAEKRRLFVTGKLWPFLFQVRP